MKHNGRTQIVQREKGIIIRALQPLRAEHCHSGDKKPVYSHFAGLAGIEVNDMDLLLDLWRMHITIL